MLRRRRASPPAASLEPQDRQQRAEHDQQDREGIAPAPRELRHHVEVHAVHAGDERGRDARDGGYFSYELSTANEKLLSLRVRYWGADWGNRKFEIYIDDKKLTTEDNTGKWNQSQFQNIEYPIPDELVAGKNKVTIKFQSLPGNTAGAVYYLQLLRKKTD